MVLHLSSTPLKQGNFPFLFKFVDAYFFIGHKNTSTLFSNNLSLKALIAEMVVVQNVLIESIHVLD